LQDFLEGKKHLFLTFKIFLQAKNICFCASKFWERRKTFVFALQNFGKDEKHLFLRFAVLGKTKNICFCAS